MLDKDIWSIVFKLLDRRSLLNLAQTCSKLQHYVNTIPTTFTYIYNGWSIPLDVHGSGIYKRMGCILKFQRSKLHGECIVSGRSNIFIGYSPSNRIVVNFNFGILQGLFRVYTRRRKLITYAYYVNGKL